MLSFKNFYHLILAGKISIGAEEWKFFFYCSYDLVSQLLNVFFVVSLGHIWLSLGYGSRRELDYFSGTCYR